MAASVDPTALATVAAAESALARGDYQRGYALAYDAAMQALSAAAGRPLSHCAAWHYVRSLDGLPQSLTHLSDPAISDRRPPLSPPRFSAYFSVAETFKDRAGIVTDAGPPDPVRYWEDSQSLYYLKPVKALVEMLAATPKAGRP